MDTPRPPHWSYRRDASGFGWLTCDRQDSTTNTLSREVLEDLATALDAVERDPPRGLVLRSAKPNGFVAGADVAEFRRLGDPAEALAFVSLGQRVFARLERLPCPSVALLHGFALGGGLELALACRYRIGADDGRLALGFPEVRLGIHPGFGGTVRAPRLVGARAALDLMLTGRTVRGARALALGLVDRLVALDALEAEAAALLAAPPAPRRAPVIDRLLSLRPLRTLLAGQVRRTLVHRVRAEHYPAPYAIVDLWERVGADPADGYEAEATSIAALATTPTARNLVRVYFLQDRLKSLGAGERSPAARVHVIGAGVMGGDIAAWCAGRGLEVTLQDRTLALIEPALARAAEDFRRHARTPAEAEASRARLRADVEGSGVAGADIVIEAIIEDAPAKRALYATLEPRLKAGAVLATNTSSLDLATLAAGLADPTRLVGLHFFNPVAKMPLVEVIGSATTAPAATAAALAFARQLDKLPLPCASAPGFVVNRILFRYMAEAMAAAAAGVPYRVIDEVALAFGMPQGPIELADTVGLDVAFRVGEVLSAAFGTERPTLLEPYLAARHLGRKTGRGFYEWRDGKPVRPPAPGATAPADLADRLVLPMLNEAVACLREGVVADEDLLDAGIIFGTGFAPFRGGPLAYARGRGVDAVTDALGSLAASYGDRFRPDPGWKRLQAGEWLPQQDAGAC